jgi:hypothetical protein
MTSRFRVSRKIRAMKPGSSLAGGRFSPNHRWVEAPPSIKAWSRPSISTRLRAGRAAEDVVCEEFV